MLQSNMQIMQHADLRGPIFDKGWPTSGPDRKNKNRQIPAVAQYLSQLLANKLAKYNWFISYLHSRHVKLLKLN